MSEQMEDSDEESVPSRAVLLSDLLPQFNSDRLYGKILTSRNITRIVNQFFNNYSSDVDDTIYDLLQLYVDLSSYQHIDVKYFAITRDISQLINYMDRSKNNILIYTSRYFLLMHNQKYRKKLCRIEKFIIKFIELSNDRKVLYDCILFYKLIKFFLQMSNSDIRATKHTGVYFALKHQTGFIKIASKIDHEIATLKENSRIEKCKRTKIRQKIAIDKLKLHNEEVNKIISFIHDKIFEKNWNLMDPVMYHMRSECIVELFHWMEIYPDKYVQNENLNLIIKAISDPHKKVRITAIKLIGKIVENFLSVIQESMVLKLIESIVKHIRDKDYNVSIMAVDTLTIIHRFTLLPEEVRHILCMNVYNIYYPLGAACGRFIVELIIDKSENKEDETLLRLLILFSQKSIERGLIDRHPLLIESIYDYFPVLQNVKAFMNILDKDLLAHKYAGNIWLNLLTESCCITFTGKCSFERNKPRKGVVNQEKIKEMTRELVTSLATLIRAYGLEKLTDLLVLMKDYTSKDSNNILLYYK